MNKKNIASVVSVALISMLAVSPICAMKNQGRVLKKERTKLEDINRTLQVMENQLFENSKKNIPNDKLAISAYKKLIEKKAKLEEQIDREETIAFENAEIEGQCPVCFEDLKGTTPIEICHSCSKKFCKVCITDWFEKKKEKKCIMCTKPFYNTMDKQANSDVRDIQMCFEQAVKQGKFGLAEHILSGNLHFKNQKNSDGNSYLSVAVDKNDEAMVGIFMICSADVNQTDKYGDPCLAIAVKKNYKLITTMLLNCGADKNQRDRHGDSCLAIAVKNNYKEVVKTLLSYDADPSKGDRFGDSCLAIAVKNGAEDIANILRLHSAG